METASTFSAPMLVVVNGKLVVSREVPAPARAGGPTGTGRLEMSATTVG